MKKSTRRALRKAARRMTKVATMALVETAAAAAGGLLVHAGRRWRKRLKKAKRR